MTLHKLTLTGFVLACGVLAASGAHAIDEDPAITALAKGTRVLTVGELNALFDEKTWQWTNGAGYFGTAPKRQFIAWTGNDTYADGSWSAANGGRVCFRATWHSIQGREPAETCFEHRSDNKVIYQRKLPNGAWYVFSHSPPQTGDEVQKLQRGDFVSKTYQANKKFVAEKTPRSGSGTQPSKRPSQPLNITQPNTAGDGTQRPKKGP
jgi:hypothetical protein